MPLDLARYLSVNSACIVVAQDSKLRPAVGYYEYR